MESLFVPVLGGIGGRLFYQYCKRDPNVTKNSTRGRQTRPELDHAQVRAAMSSGTGDSEPETHEEEVEMGGRGEETVPASQKALEEIERLNEEVIWGSIHGVPRGGRRRHTGVREVCHRPANGHWWVRLLIHTGLCNGY